MYSKMFAHSVLVGCCRLELEALALALGIIV